MRRGNPGGVLEGRARPDTGERTSSTVRADADTGSGRPVRLGPQILVVLAAVMAYFLVRGFTEGSVARALHNARSVVSFERRFGLYHELSWQQATDSAVVSTVVNWIYIWGHWPVIAVTLIWLARRHPEHYRRTRNAMLLSGAVGLVVFTTFPVAPPRLADLGMVDTVTVSSHAYRVLQPAFFTNQYAAMPSLHVGWDLLMGLAVLTAVRHPLWRLAGLLMPTAMAVAVVLSANHYIVDVLVGCALTGTCWVLMGRVSRPGGKAADAVT